jgi:hypothetical protein
MHDVIGGAGMLRGWIALWTMEMFWFSAAMTLTVGAVAIAELLFTARADRVKATMLAAMESAPV